MEKNKSTKDDCVRFPSKSRPGRFFSFNRSTGETKWLPIKQTEGPNDEIQNSPLKLLKKTVKTPAQDRLKRLQSGLKLRQTKPCTSLTKPKHLKMHEDYLDVGPSKISPSKSSAKSPKKEMGRPVVFRNLKAELVKCSKSPVEENLKPLPLPDSSTVKGTNGIFAVVSNQDSQHSSKQLVNNKGSQDMETNTSIRTNMRSGFVKKIKEICKLPLFNTTKQIADQKPHPETDNTRSLINTSKFKAKSKQILSTSLTKESIINQIKEESEKPPGHNIFTCPPKYQSIPSYPRGSANARLERLKQSLQQESNRFLCCPNTIVTENTMALLFQKKNRLNSWESTNGTGPTREDEVETMDWQPITKEEIHGVATILQPTLAVEKSRKLSLKAFNVDEHLTMGDIIDTVNENLLRLSAEKQKDAIDSKRKWRKDFYYFVVDTNVLLRDITFVEDLSKMKLCDTKGSLLYIPYSVLQELDRLKMRSGAQEGVKTQAIRAIKYLNNKLENNSLHVQAQSAAEERRRLIDVNSADDSIINCCLQVKAHIPNLLFLTEDVNLRNKAICNNIMVSTKSDLTAKRYDSTNIS